MRIKPKKMIERLAEKLITEKINSGKAIILLGARQTGKTTLLKKISDNLPDVLWLNADEPDIAALFDSPSSTRFKAVFGGHKTVIIDEAQRIENENN